MTKIMNFVLCVIYHKQIKKVLKVKEARGRPNQEAVFLRLRAQPVPGRG